MRIATTIETVSPAQARKMLAQNTTNRKVRPRHVAMLSREIVEGRWAVNGQPVIFANTGRLIDGQHRLEAIVLADKPAKLTITRGVPEAAFATLDQGLKRSASDDLRSMGIHNATGAAAAARLILTWTKGMAPKMASVAKTEITDFIRAHPEIGEIVNTVHPTRRSVPTSAMVAVYWMAHRDGDKKIAEKMEVFMRGLSTGADLTVGSPILTLRNTGQTFRRGASMSSEGWFGLTMQAWNAFAAGETRQVFKNTNWPAQVAGYTETRSAIAVLDRDIASLRAPKVATG
jgi:hypothetical protein